MFTHPQLAAQQQTQQAVEQFNGTVLINNKHVTVTNNSIQPSQLEQDLVGLIQKAMEEKRYFSTVDKNYVVGFYADVPTSNGVAMNMLIKLVYPLSVTWIGQLLFEQQNIEEAIRYRERMQITIKPSTR